MKADKQFDFYEFAGIVIPGAILVAGLAQVVAPIGAVITVKEMSLGSLGLFLILSYAAGHLVQTLGNLLENVWWYFPGMPTDWPRTGRGHLLSPTQRTALQDQLPRKLGLRPPIELSALNGQEWFSMTRQIYAAVAAAGRSLRIDTFNGNYGLNRGLASALIAVAIVVLLQSCDNWKFALGLAVASLAALYRMHRFARHYARELFVQFLQLPLPDGPHEKKPIIVEPSRNE